MSEPTACCGAPSCPEPRTSRVGYCDRCDVLVGLPGLRVVAVARVHSRRGGGEGLVVTVESPPGVQGCPGCGVVARSHGRRTVELGHPPCFGRPVMLRWRKRTWTCPDPGCAVGTFTEQDPRVAPARAL